ncbi:MAG: alpha/beta hydrolase [Verrucomicrobiota bacterium]
MSTEEPVDRPAPPGAELVWVEDVDSGSRVEGWFFEASNNENEKSPALIFFHGNSELIGHCLEFAETYPKHGMSVLLVEYRGYGRSTGDPSREAIRKDMIKFYDWLANKPSVDKSRIVFHGRSIGAAVAADLSLYRKPAAMILSSTFASMELMFWRYWMPGFIAKDKYRTEDVVASSDFPILVLHGSLDDITPVEHGRRLANVAQQADYIEYNTNHDLPLDWYQFEMDIMSFLRRADLIDRFDENSQENLKVVSSAVHVIQ